MENEENREARRAGAIEGLRAAFAELESGEGLTRLVGEPEGTGERATVEIAVHDMIRA